MPTTTTQNELKTEFQDMLASTANIKASSGKQERTLRRILDRLQMFGNWNFTIRKTIFEYISDVEEYSVQNYIGLTDFKEIYSLDNISILDRRQFNNMMEDVAPGRKDGIDYLKVKLNKGNAITVDTLSSIDSDGEWLVANDAVNLSKDTKEYVQGGASLKFDIDVDNDVANKAVIYNSTLASKNLTDYEDISYFLVDVYLTDATDLTSITLKWGSSTGAYWYLSATKPINETAFQVGWNKVSFKWEDASSTGSPDVTGIDYISVELDYGAGYTDKTSFRINNLRLCQRFQVDLEYFSTHMAKDSGGTWKARPIENTDIVLCDNHMKPLILEWGYYELLRFAKKISRAEIQEASENVDVLKTEAFKKFGFSHTKGSKRLNIGR